MKILSEKNIMRTILLVAILLGLGILGSKYFTITTNVDHSTDNSTRTVNQSITVEDGATLIKGAK